MQEKMIHCLQRIPTEKQWFKISSEDGAFFLKLYVVETFLRTTNQQRVSTRGGAKSNHTSEQEELREGASSKTLRNDLDENTLEG